MYKCDYVKLFKSFDSSIHYVEALMCTQIILVQKF